MYYGLSSEHARITDNKIFYLVSLLPPSISKVAHFTPLQEQRHFTNSQCYSILCCLLPSKLPFSVLISSIPSSVVSSVVPSYDVSGFIEVTFSCLHAHLLSYLLAMWPAAGFTKHRVRKISSYKLRMGSKRHNVFGYATWLVLSPIRLIIKLGGVWWNRRLSITTSLI